MYNRISHLRKSKIYDLTGALYELFAIFVSQSHGDKGLDEIIHVDNTSLYELQ